MKGQNIIRFTYTAENELQIVLSRLQGLKYRVSIKEGENGRKTAYIKLFLRNGCQVETLDKEQR